MKKIKVIIVDDHKIFRNGLRQMLEDIPFVSEIKDVSQGIEFLKLVETFNADVVLMDIKMPDMNGIEATKEVLKIKPDMKVIALSMYDNGEYIKRMFDAGSKGYLLKNVEEDELATALDIICFKNDYYYSIHLSSSLINGFLYELDKTKQIPITKTLGSNKLELTKRGMEIIELAYKGLSGKEIGRLLNISDRTVQGHKARLFNKLNVKNTQELVKFAVENNLV